MNNFDQTQENVMTSMKSGARIVLSLIAGSLLACMTGCTASEAEAQAKQPAKIESNVEQTSESKSESKDSLTGDRTKDRVKAKPVKHENKLDPVKEEAKTEPRESKTVDSKIKVPTDSAPPVINNTQLSEATDNSSDHAEPGDGDETSTGKRIALLIGVRAYYPDRFSPLPGAEPDVTKLSKVLIQKGFDRENVTLMTNTAGASDPRFLPLSNNIRKQLRNLEKTCTANDSVVIALAGHGVQQKGKKYWFCPFDADLEDENTLISINEIYASLGKCKAKFKLVLIDACREDTLAQPNANSETVAGAMADMPNPPARTATFVSCSQGQLAYERQKEGHAHGVFFHAVIEGLGGAAVGQDGTVTLPDLERYVKKNVQSYVEKTYSAEQFPILRNNTVGLFPIVENSFNSEQVDRIQWLVQRDKYDEAMKIVEGLLATNPRNGIALASRSRILSYKAESDSDLSRLPEALADALLAVEISPNEPDPHVALANVYRLKKEYEKSLAESAAAIQIDPNHVLAHTIRGMAFHGMKDLEQLTVEAQKAIEIDPEHPEARGLLAAALFALDRMEEGQMELDRAIAITPDIGTLFFLKGYGYEQVGDHNKAVLQYTSAIKVDPDKPSYYVRRAISLGNAGDYPSAWEDVARAEAINPNYFDVTSARAMLLINQQKWEEALVALNKGLKINPDTPDLLMGRGFAYVYTQRLELAEKDLKHLIEISPDRAEGHMGMGFVSFHRNRFDEALTHLSRATRFNSRSSESHYLKAACYMKKGDFKSAIPPLSKAIELDPKNAVYYQQRSMLYQGAGRNNEARQDMMMFQKLQHAH